MSQGEGSICNGDSLPSAGITNVDPMSQRLRNTLGNVAAGLLLTVLMVILLNALRKMYSYCDLDDRTTSTGCSQLDPQENNKRAGALEESPSPYPARSIAKSNPKERILSVRFCNERGENLSEEAQEHVVQVEKVDRKVGDRITVNVDGIQLTIPISQ